MKTLTLSLALVLMQGLAISQADKGVIAGRIRSLDGRPAAGVRVAAIPAYAAVPTNASELSSLSQTDASGSFRLENLAPGRYRVMAGLVAFPTYYPGVSDEGGAGTIEVTAGAAVTGIDFAMVRPSNLKISGRVVLPEPVAGPGAVARVSLLPRTPQSPMMPANVPIQTDGTFEISNVIPGSYSVMASAPNMALKEPVTITVDATDVSGIQLVMLRTDKPTTLQGLEQAWSLPGTWTAAASGAKNPIVYALDQRRGIRAEVDASGKVIREIMFPNSSILRLAQFEAGAAFLGFRTWSPTVNAYDDSGKLLWAYPPESVQASGIDDAWPADLDGDGSDEVIIGFNGGTGLHVINGKGELVWQATGIGNVWHVAAGDLQGSGRPQAVTTSAAGQIHVFSSGTDRRNINPGFYANMVRVGKPSDQDFTATIFAGGTSLADSNIATLGAFSADGTKKWSADLPSIGRPSISSTYLAPGKPWLAVSLQSGQVFVIDAARGTVIATVDGQGMGPELAWLPGKDPNAEPLLVISTRSALTAYRVLQK